MKQPLEKHRFFPLIAWALVIGFAVFVTYIAFALKENLQVLADNTTRTQGAVNDAR